MRSADDDLTARALIRNAALALFAEHGPDAVSVRQIAAAADVSPGLVLHHFGSKGGLREAVDAYAADAFDAVMEVGADADIAAVLARGDGGSIAAAFSRVFPPGSPLPAYLRRLLLSGDPAGVTLFRDWHRATDRLLEEMGRMGLVRDSVDPEVRAAFVLANDLALLLLRPALRESLGFDPLDPAGLARWAEEVSAVYRDGLWTTEPRDGAQGAGRSGAETSRLDEGGDDVRSAE